MIIKKYKDELEYIEIQNSSATAKIALQGAHVFHYQKEGEDALLWLSDTSSFKKGKAIRGGIPICWPWFGAHPKEKNLPNHGFARTALWDYVSNEIIDESTTKVVLRLVSNETSLALWPNAFEVRLEVIISDTLTLTLSTKNCTNKPFKLSQALHTYFRVTDIKNTVLEGLEGKKYYDKLTDRYLNVQKEPLIFNEEVDRIYSDITKPLIIKSSSRDITVQTEHSTTTVVWNPWEKRALQMVDLSTYKTMLCVESANVLEDARLLQPQEYHTLKVTYKT